MYIYIYIIRYQRHAWLTPSQVRSPNEARTVRSEGGRLFVYKEHEGLTLNITNILPHEAALQILSFMKELVAQRDEAIANDETTPLEAREPLWS